jgi:hypothetical protein
MRLRVPLHGHVLLSAFLTTFVFASRLASISAALLVDVTRWLEQARKQAGRAVNAVNAL